MIQMKPDKEAFERICRELEKGHSPLNCKDIADVFGWPAIELFLILGTPSPEYCKEITELLRQIRNLQSVPRRSK